MLPVFLLGEILTISLDITYSNLSPDISDYSSGILPSISILLILDFWNLCYKISQLKLRNSRSYLNPEMF